MGKYLATRNPEVSGREIEGRKRSKEIAKEAVVLLENDGVLPLKAVGTVALFGNGARHTIKGGTGSGSVNSRSFVNIEQGLNDAGFQVVTKDWLSRFDIKKKNDYEEYRNWVINRAKELNTEYHIVAMCEGPRESTPESLKESDLVDAETCIYVVGRNSGEGRDRNEGRGDYMLYEEELEIIEKLAGKYDKFILVLNIGGILDMSEIKNIKGINAIVLLGQLGNITGEVLPEVLLGNVNPSGRLTDTWACKYEDYPSSSTFSHVNGNINEEIYTEGIYVGYRYFDTFRIPVIYPFGYGLSYTKFESEYVESSIDGNILTISVKVKNVGEFAGKEVVEVYGKAPKGKIDKEAHRLVGYVKTSVLKPGDEETVKVSFDIKDMASFCENCSAYVLHGGAYVFSIGANSRDVKDVLFVVLDEKVKIRLCKKLWEKDPVLSELSSSYKLAEGLDSDNTKVEDIEGSDNVDVINIKASDFNVITYEYTEERKELITDIKDKVTLDMILKGEAKASDLVAQLSVKELAFLAVGKHKKVEDGDAGLVGNSSVGVPGAAGDTSDHLADRGIRSIIMADGPAGLRLQPIFKTDLDNNYIKGGEMFDDAITPLDDSYDDSNSYTYYQYATAIPIAWSLAQTWNTDAINEAGLIVGNEMEEFGVDLWLAPGMNIHRNPLCGRNFEYYSEDPLISGKCAAFITKGIQSYKGKGTTIKHFAANNQEDNRFFVNNIMSERALREIYLRGFEIAVKEAAPLALMTSYNLIAGEHTSNSFRLVQNILKDEWGYKGLVMSDWCTTVDYPEQYYLYDIINPKSAPSGCVKAGNDLIMPGVERDVEDIIKAVETGEAIENFSCTKADLQACALRVVETLVEIEKRKLDK